MANVNLLLEIIGIVTLLVETIKCKIINDADQFTPYHGFTSVVIAPGGGYDGIVSSSPEGLLLHIYKGGTFIALGSTNSNSTDIVYQSGMFTVSGIFVCPELIKHNFTQMSISQHFMTKHYIVNVSIILNPEYIQMSTTRDKSKDIFWISGEKRVYKLDIRPLQSGTYNNLIIHLLGETEFECGPTNNITIFDISEDPLLKGRGYCITHTYGMRSFDLDTMKETYSADKCPQCHSSDELVIVAIVGIKSNLIVFHNNVLGAYADSNGELVFRKSIPKIQGIYGLRGLYQTNHFLYATEIEMKAYSFNGYEFQKNIHFAESHERFTMCKEMRLPVHWSEIDDETSFYLAGNNSFPQIKVSNGFLVPKCLEDEGYNRTTKACIKCSELTHDCLECETTNVTLMCSKCSGNSTWSQSTGKCHKNCKINQAWDMEVKKCISCISKTDNCATCEYSTTKCLTCQNDYVLTSNNTCQKNCTSSQAFVSPDSCVDCSDITVDCVKCKNETKICLECDTNYWLNSSIKCQKKCGVNQAWIAPNNCIDCVDNCDKCENKTYICLNCKTGFWYNSTSKACQVKCETNEAFVPPGNCVKCSETTLNCATCLNTTKECDNCSDGFWLNNTKKCQKQCDSDSSWHQLDNSCKLCNIQTPLCTKCNNNTKVPTAQNSTCITCAPTYHLNETNKCQKTCKDDQAWIENNTCEDCDKSSPNCVKCQNSTKTCISCQYSHYLNLSSDIKCKRKCNEDQAWIQGDTCVACSKNNMFCKRCNNVTKDCTQCEANYFLNSSGNCQRKCEKNQAWVDTNHCVNCSLSDKHCTRCDNSTKKCRFCEFTHFITQTYNCQLKCDQDSIDNGVDGCVKCALNNPGCTKCSSGDNVVCTECGDESVYWLNSSLCQLKCNENEAWNKEKNSCELCSNFISHCTNCENITKKCKSCESTHWLTDENKCQRSCQANEAWISTDSCSSCSENHPGCDRCDDKTKKCTRCGHLEENYHLNSTNQCQKNCPLNSAWIQDTNSCEACNNGHPGCDKCDDVTTTPSTQNKTCTRCGDGSIFWLNSTKKCQKICSSHQIWVAPNDCKDCFLITDNCISCSNTTKICEKCSSTHFLDENKECKIKCLPNYAWVKPNNCELCSKNHPGCEKCLNITKECISCGENELVFFLNSTQQCQIKCNSNQAWDMLSNTCYDCTTTDIYCNKCENKTKICTECYPTHWLNGTACQKICDVDQVWLNDTNSCENCSLSTPFCLSCENSTKECNECESNYFLNKNKTCQKKCNIHEAWVKPNNCEKCDHKDSVCTKCTNITNICTECGTSDTHFVNSNDECQLKCKDPLTHWIEKNNTCQLCSTSIVGCSQCKNMTNSGEKICTQCDISDYFLNSKICQKICEVNQIWIQKTNECVTCQSIDKGCINCKNNTGDCIECSPGFWKNLTNKCQTKCKPKGETWMPPNNCEPCATICKVCQNGTKVCLEGKTGLSPWKLTREISMDLQNYLAFKLFIFKEDSINQFDYSKIQKTPTKKWFDLFTISYKTSNNQRILSSGIISSYTQARSGSFYTYIRKPPTTSEYIITAKTHLNTVENSTTLILKLKDDISQSFKIEKPLVPHALTQGMIKLKNYFGTGSSSVISILEVLAFVGVFMAFDPSWALLQLFIFLKFISRLVYINVYFGSFLEDFLIGLNQIIDPKLDIPVDNIFNIQNGQKGKFNLYERQFFFVDQTAFRFIFYLISWICKLTGLIFCEYIKKERKILKWMQVFIQKHSMFHYALFLVFSIDCAFFGARALFHSSWFISSNSSKIVPPKGMLLHCFFAIVGFTLVLIDSFLILSRSRYQRFDYLTVKLETRFNKFTKIVDAEFKRYYNTLAAYKNVAKNLHRYLKKELVHNLRKNTIRLPDHLPEYWLQQVEGHLLGYRKRLNFTLSYYLLKRNHLLDQFLIPKYNENSKFIRNTSIQEKLIFVIRIFIYMIIIVGLSWNPTYASLFCLTMELFYFLNLFLKLVKKERYIETTLILVLKEFQSLAIVAFLFMIINRALYYSDSKDERVPVSFQNFGVYLIVFMIISQIFILFVELFVMLKNCFLPKQDKSRFDNYNVHYYQWIRSTKIEDSSKHSEKHASGLNPLKIKKGFSTKVFPVFSKNEPEKK